MKNIVFIYGNTCSGKSTLAKKLQNCMQYNYISFGDEIRKEIENANKRFVRQKGGEKKDSGHNLAVEMKSKIKEGGKNEKDVSCYKRNHVFFWYGWNSPCRLC